MTNKGNFHRSAPRRSSTVTVRKKNAKKYGEKRQKKQIAPEFTCIKAESKMLVLWKDHGNFLWKFLCESSFASIERGRSRGTHFALEHRQQFRQWRTTWDGTRKNEKKRMKEWKKRMKKWKKGKKRPIENLEKLGTGVESKRAGTKKGRNKPPYQYLWMPAQLKRQQRDLL